MSARDVVRFLLGASIALALAVLLIAARYQLEIARQSEQLQSLLQAASDEIAAELERAGQIVLSQRSAGNGSRWRSWHLNSSGYQDSQGHRPPIPEETLRRALAARTGRRGATLLIGPLATEQSGNALVLAEPLFPARQQTPANGPEDSGVAVEWRGDWAPVDEVMSQPHVIRLMKQGYRLQVYDTAASLPLYQSDSGHLGSAAAVAIRFRGSRLELRAAPRAGWRIPPRVLAPSLLVALAVVLWLSFELQRHGAVRRAAAELAEAETRRKDLSVSYGKALESLSELESRLHMVSMYDSVTGLANRSSLVRRIEATLESMRQSRQGRMCVLAIGFDQAHHIPNSFGAEFASRVLVIVAERVESVLPSKDLLFRTGDFHLAVVLPDADAARCAELAQKVVETIQSPIELDSHTFMLHPAIGIAEATSGYEYAETLLDHAGTALSAVSREAPARYCLFDSATARESVSRLQLEVDLDRAFEEGQLVLEFEPFVLPVAQSVAGFEALIRWDHPTEGRLPPGRFVPIAVQAGMAHRLNDWVLREAARQAAAWRRAGHTEVFVNFNLSAEAFLRPRLVEEIGAVLEEFDLPGQQLIVELTESTLVQDLRGAARTLQRLGELGVGAWLDDFGTGYSSLSHLRVLPLKGVKIDRSFIERIDVDARDFGFLKALIDLISYLGMQSIVEGIETASQFELLSLTACDLYQGFHFAHSMSAADAERWMIARVAGTAPGSKEPSPAERIVQRDGLRRHSS